MIAGILWLLDHVPARLLRRLVAALATLMVAGLIALLLIAPSPGSAANPRSAPRSSLVPPSRTTTTIAPVSTSPKQPSLAVPAAAAKAARRFLAGYLAYAYRQAPAQAIPAAARKLRQALSTAQARTPPTARRLDPTVSNLQVLRDTARDATAVASITNGTGITYPLTLQLQATTDGWQVVSLGDD